MLAAFLSVGLGACTAQSPVEVEVDDIGDDDWVVVVYAFDDRQPSAMLELLDTEMGGGRRVERCRARLDRRQRDR